MQPTQNRYSWLPSNFGTSISMSSIQEVRVKAAPGQGWPRCSNCVSVDAAVSGMFASSMTRKRRMSVSAGTCSMKTGHCSWQAPQLTQSQIEL